MAALPPVSREQAFLETYFQCLSQFAYDKAKESCDKERETHKPQTGSSWSLMVAALSKLAAAEKAYSSLMFLGQKFFGRKDNLRTSYASLQSDLRKIEDATTRMETQLVLDIMLEKLMGHLCGQLVQFLTARSKTMDFYEQMATMGTLRNMNYDDLLIVITDIIQAHSKNFHHPILSPLKSSFSLECDVMNHLLQAHLQMARCQFLPTLLHLNDAHSKLAAWMENAPVRETKKLGFGMSKHPPIPALYQWLTKYKAVLVSKFSLYFYDVLSKQAPPVDMKGALSKAAVDFCGKIVSFHRKSDAAYVALVFDSNGLEAQRGIGYHHPKKFTEVPKGLDSYPAIFCYPSDRPEKHWPSVISIMNDKVAELNTSDKLVYFCDEKFQNTYFIVRIEPRITLVVIFEAKKTEKDSYITNFLTDFAIQLRCTKLFAALRPGTKG